MLRKYISKTDQIRPIYLVTTIAIFLAMSASSAADSQPVPSPGSITTERVPKGWKLVFQDDFAGSGILDTTSSDRNWRFETMDDGLHRAGNTGLDEHGNLVEDWRSVRGKRWSAWYNRYNNTNAYRENGNLVMGGIVSNEPDPTRPIDYVDDGVLTQYGSRKLYTAWIDTFSRKWDNERRKHVIDRSSPARIFRYGYFEAKVSFSQIMTPGFRFSIWLMPASKDARGNNLVVSKAYDNDANNGVEIDNFEYEWISQDAGNRINLALLGGSAGSSHSLIDTSEYGISLRKGFHTVALSWTADRLAWIIDGILVKEILDANLIPDVYSYLILSREMNSGVKWPGLDDSEDSDMLAEYPYIPRDPGLFAKNVWQYKDRIPLDHAIVDYIRIWQP